MTRIRRASATAVVAVGIAVGTVAVQPIVSAARDEANSLPDQATRAAVGKEVQGYPDVAAMTAASDLVVKATVTGVERGRTVGPKEDTITFRKVGLDIDQVVYQRPGRPTPRSVIVEEEGWASDGTGYTMNGVAWSRRGDTGYYFLHRKTDGSRDTYRLIGSHGRALVIGSSVALSGDNTHGEGPWGRTAVATRGIGALQTELQAAAVRARSRAVHPLTPR
jgi:hypothetical protein